MEKLGLNIEQNFYEQKPTFETMKTPEVVIREEKGAQLLSLLLKAKNPY